MLSLQRSPFEGTPSVSVTSLIEVGKESERDVVIRRVVVLSKQRGKKQICLQLFAGIIKKTSAPVLNREYEHPDFLQSGTDKVGEIDHRQRLVSTVETLGAEKCRRFR